jgi:hypothetical protein
METWRNKNTDDEDDAPKEKIIGWLISQATNYSNIWQGA